jgi:hypothetical protein
MRELINIYCDESCHLQNDGERIMVIGAVWCKAEKKNEIFERLKEIKAKHKMFPSFLKDTHSHQPIFEVKWNKISQTKLQFFKDFLDYFFTDDDLNFRVLIVPNKKDLDYAAFGHTHDTFYYKMYFDMLKVILNPTKAHNIFIDIKDTKSREKVHKLEEVLRNNHYDYQKQIIKKIQQVRSHEIELIQLADLLTGALSYVHRGLKTSQAKNELVEFIRHRSKYSLLKSTLVQEKKFNVFIWRSTNLNTI